MPSQFSKAIARAGQAPLTQGLTVSGLVGWRHAVEQRAVGGHMIVGLLDNPPEANRLAAGLAILLGKGQSVLLGRHIRNGHRLSGSDHPWLGRTAIDVAFAL